MSIATTADLERAPSSPRIMRLAVTAACAALADRLFFGWDIGISLALFLGVSVRLPSLATACTRRAPFRSA
jgi:hypothetical protein